MPRLTKAARRLIRLGNEATAKRRRGTGTRIGERTAHLNDVMADFKRATGPKKKR